jgi:hypothetical protein
LIVQLSTSLSWDVQNLRSSHTLHPVALLCHRKPHDVCTMITASTVAKWLHNNILRLQSVACLPQPDCH